MEVKTINEEKMYCWFLLMVAGLNVSIYLHVKSVDHIKLVETYGKEKGAKRGRLYGTLSGTLESICLLGVWVSPQPALIFPAVMGYQITLMGMPISLLQIPLSVPLIAFGAWLGIAGVRAVGLKVADTHAVPPRLIKTGVYGIVRHPQYLGWILAHVGISILASALFALIFTPLLIVMIYLISRAEENDLVENFGDQYKSYIKEVPMFIPRASPIIALTSRARTNKIGLKSP